MKIHQFLSPSPGQQKSEKLLPRLPKTMKKRSRNHKNSDFCEKVVFATPLTPKACFKSSRGPDFDAKIRAKSDLKTSTKKNTDFRPQCPKSSQNGVPKSPQNPIPDPKVSCLLFPWSPRVLPRCQNGPQGAKMEAPGLPNDTRGGLKGAGGRGRSP